MTTTYDYDEVLRSLGLEPSGGDPRGCGTYPGYIAHLNDGQQPCDDCRQANADYKRARRAAPKDPKRLQPINHGTPTGARQHWYRGGKPCQSCRDAYNTVNSPRKREQKRLAKARKAAAQTREQVAA